MMKDILAWFIKYTLILLNLNIMIRTVLIYSILPPVIFSVHNYYPLETTAYISITLRYKLVILYCMELFRNFGIGKYRRLTFIKLQRKVIYSAKIMLFSNVLIKKLTPLINPATKLNILKDLS